MDEIRTSGQSRWRVFLALWPDDEALDALEPIDRWVRRHDSHRLTPRERRHLTVAFLGDVEPSILPALAELLAPIVAAHHSFDAPLTGVLGLPNERSPRILAAGVEPSGVSPLIQHVLETIDGLLDCDPVRRDLLREPRPHITIARTRRGARARRLDVSKAPSIDGRLRVDAICAVRSRLTDQGPIYNPIWSIELGRAV